MEQNLPEGKNFIRNVAIKALVIFLVFNLIFAVLPTEKWLGKVSLYNHLFPGRWRFSWSENPGTAYAVSTNNLDALFESHEVSARPVPDDEYRIFFFGDSSVWGFLLEKEETLTTFVNAANLHAPDGKTVRAYNLGYPTISLTKDLLLIEKALQYQPDMIVWSVTLEAFPAEKQIFTPLVEKNDSQTRSLIQSYDLEIELTGESLPAETLWDKTLIGKRRAVADLLRLQLYGVLWAGTGIDQDIPETYTPLQVNYDPDDNYYNFSPPNLDRDQLALDVLQAGMEMAGDIPVLIVNEPVYISSGENSDIRYNFYYPVWAYDEYREILQTMPLPENCTYLDLWDQIPPENFTNTAIHVDAAGSQQLAGLIIEKIRETMDN